MINDKKTAAELEQSLRERAACRPEELDRDAMREAGCWDRVALVPQDPQDRLSYFADVLVQATCSQGKRDERLNTVANHLCQTLSYLVNSCSWREGDLQDFDLAEVKSKLRRIGLLQYEVEQELNS